METTGPKDQEHFGWRTFRAPPSAAIAFGAVYGAIVGAFVAWDIAVIIRLFWLARHRVGQELERRHSDNESDLR